MIVWKIVAEEMWEDDPRYGDRIRLVVDTQGDTVTFHREGKSTVFPEWTVDPDAGLAMSVKQARELYAALGELLKMAGG